MDIHLPPNLLVLLPSVIGAGFAVRGALPKIDGGRRVLLLALVIATVALLLVAAPLNRWIAVVRDAVLLGTAAFGVVNTADRIAGAFGSGQPMVVMQAVAASALTGGNAPAGDAAPRPQSAPTLPPPPPTSSPDLPLPLPPGVPAEREERLAAPAPITTSSTGEKLTPVQGAGAAPAKSTPPPMPSASGR